MDSQAQLDKKKKAFLHFILRNFFSQLKKESNIKQIIQSKNEEQMIQFKKKKKYGIKELNLARSKENQRDVKFRAYLTHIAPNLIFKARLSLESITDYFEELDILQQIVQSPEKSYQLKSFKNLNSSKNKKQYLKKSQQQEQQNQVITLDSAQNQLIEQQKYEILFDENDYFINEINMSEQII
ncbi:unnamed protein product [Paramecium sonneborni]|uniref:Uncharacterized protein n=1 Tax=Paramecium sonneborni TaxID=65129 RepID=A0A8S1R6R8_9CILI|nr:unnamed protein product [Paramecium sonneborni]